jgi:hypothetical protein
LFWIVLIYCTYRYFYSILFYSILFYSILFYCSSILFYCIVLFYWCLNSSILYFLFY